MQAHQRTVSHPTSDASKNAGHRTTPGFAAAGAFHRRPDASLTWARYFRPRPTPTRLCPSNRSYRSSDSKSQSPSDSVVFRRMCYLHHDPCRTHEGVLGNPVHPKTRVRTVTIHTAVQVRLRFDYCKSLFCLAPKGTSIHVPKAAGTVGSS